MKPVAGDIPAHPCDEQNCRGLPRHYRLPISARLSVLGGFAHKRDPAQKGTRLHKKQGRQTGGGLFLVRLGLWSLLLLRWRLTALGFVQPELSHL
jgi:hypothetical protein